MDPEDVFSLATVLQSSMLYRQKFGTSEAIVRFILAPQEPCHVVRAGGRQLRGWALA